MKRTAYGVCGRIGFGVERKNLTKARDLIRSGKDQAWRIVRTVYRYKAVQRLQREMRADRTLDEWVDFAWSFHERIGIPIGPVDEFAITPLQLVSEISRMLTTLKTAPPRTVLEIGTASGGSLFLVARTATPDALMVSVDLPVDSGGYAEWRTPLYASFASPGQTIYLVRGDSHTEETKECVLEALRGRPLDFLFIDGDHSYAGVATDFRLYSPLVREGGLIALHDIVTDYAARFGRPTGNCTGEVPRFWKEVCARNSTTEIIEDPEQDGYGLGLVRWGAG